MAGTSAGGSIANAVVYLNRDLGSPVKVKGQFLSVAPLLPPPVVPERYKDDYVSHEQNRDVAIPSVELGQLFLGEINHSPSEPILELTYSIRSCLQARSYLPALHTRYSSLGPCGNSADLFASLWS